MARVPSLMVVVPVWVLAAVIVTAPVPFFVSVEAEVLLAITGVDRHHVAGKVVE